MRAGRRLKPLTLAVLTTLVALPLAGCANTIEGPTTISPITTTPTTPPDDEPASGTPTSDDFETATSGALPAGWTVVAGNWRVTTNDTAPKGAKVLLSDQTDLGETLILSDAAGEWSDLDASVKINVLAGESGQAGGIAFRYEDEDNYYVVRYNHAELSWNLFRTIDGKRQKFDGTPESEAIEVALNKWFDLKLEANGNHIRVLSGGVEVLDYTEEDTNAPKSGKVGLWTRYDSKTLFDDFRIAAD